MSSQSRRIDCKSKEKKEKPKMLPMWIFICFDERSEETHENSLWWKIIQIPMSCTCSVFNVQASNLEDQLKIIRGEKSNSKQCDFCDNFFVSLYFHNNIFPTQKKDASWRLRLCRKEWTQIFFHTSWIQMYQVLDFFKYDYIFFPKRLQLFFLNTKWEHRSYRIGENGKYIFQ